MKSVAFVTIGCKLNQFETEQMRETASHAGYLTAPAAGKADVYVINTCTVTAKSDYRSRQAVRRVLRLNPGATVIVTGCYAQLAARDLARIDGVDLVIGNAEKRYIGRYIGMPKQPDPIVEVADAGRMIRLSGSGRLHSFGKYTRAFVKIQDGCDNRCSYCAVPLARGRGRSKAIEDIRAEIGVLVEEGYREIVLTGVHLGSYGRDVSPPGSLAGLLEVIASLEGPERIRLSSIEPTDFTDDLIDLIADPGARICPHVHIPLQSGDNHMLSLMGRHYSASLYADTVSRIAERIPLCGIGADVMVGFPGEEEKAFRNTYDLIDRLPLTYLHVFSVSPRYVTPASRMPGQIDSRTKKQRSSILRRLGHRKSGRFRTSLIGSTFEVLVLGTHEQGMATGLSGNYVRFLIEDAAEPNTIATCRVTDVEGTGVRAVTCGSPSACSR